MKKVDFFFELLLLLLMLNARPRENNYWSGSLFFNIPRERGEFVGVGGWYILKLVV